jgi:hypothetical protein
VPEETRDPFIEQIASELKRPVRLDARFDERVMAALDAPDVIPLHPAREARRPWIVRPWTVSVSPISAFAVAAALVAVVAMGAWQLRPVDRVQVASNATEGGNLVPVADVGAEPLVVHQFTFYATSAKSLAVVGQFNGWDQTATPMTEVSKGMWTVSVPLRLGVYEYQFIIDGTTRVIDPSMPQVPSDFGSPNSVVTISRKAPQ